MTTWRYQQVSNNSKASQLGATKQGKHCETFVHGVGNMGFCKDNGKENGNYQIRMKLPDSILVLYYGYIGIMEMETTLFLYSILGFYMYLAGCLEWATVFFRHPELRFCGLLRQLVLAAMRLA